MLQELSEGEFRVPAINASTPAKPINIKTQPSKNVTSRSLSKNKSIDKLNKSKDVVNKKVAKTSPSKSKLTRTQISNTTSIANKSAMSLKNAGTVKPQSEHKKITSKLNNSSPTKKTINSVSQSTRSKVNNSHSGNFTRRSTDDSSRIQLHQHNRRGLPPTSGNSLRQSKEAARISNSRHSSEGRLIRRSAGEEAMMKTSSEAAALGGDNTSTVANDSLKASSTRDSSMVTSPSETRSEMNQDDLRNSVQFVKKVSTLRHSMEAAQDVVNQGWLKR